MLVTKVMCILILDFNSSYHQYAKLKRVKSYGDGMYQVHERDGFVNGCENNEQLPSSNELNGVMGLECISCQQKAFYETDRTIPVPSSSARTNSEAAESSLSMLLWDRDDAPVHSSYRSTELKNNSMAPLYPAIPTTTTGNYIT